MRTTYKPVPKVVAAGLGGAVATLLLWVVETASEVTAPAPVAAAVATLAAFACGYLRAPADTEPGSPDHQPPDGI
jgi:hypothetical protein